MGRFTLRLFGTFQAQINGKTLTGFRSNKARALLAFSAVESDRAHRRDVLATLFWPTGSDQAARANLRMTLSNLRQILAPIETPKHNVLETDRENVRLLAHHPQLWIDVVHFDRRIQETETHDHEELNHCLACMQRFAEAIAFYRGEFLAGLSIPDSPEFDEWRLLQQERLYQQAVNALQRLSSYYAALGDYEKGLQYARHYLSLAPWQEAAHQQVMRILALDGQRAAAWAQFESCCQLLADELGVEPMAETVALAEQIRAGRPIPTSITRSSVSTPGRHNLPHQLTPFIGRGAEITAVCQLLLDPAYHLVTLTGTGGVGKTRLALAIAKRMLGQFAQGVWFVSLATVGAAQTEGEGASALTEMATAVGTALSLAFHGDESPSEQLLGYLRHKEMLIILDNFEQLLSLRLFVDQMLRNGPQITLLITSRQPLKLQSEFSVQVEGLPLPATDEAEAASKAESVQLFVERANRTPAGFKLTTETISHVVNICRQVDGLPLGIELAATWMAHYSPAEIVAQMRQDIDFLAAEMPDVTDRHHSIRKVFTHSWRLLSSREQKVLAQTAFFQSEFSREAATAVTETTLNELIGLVEKSLLRRSSSGYYSLHPLLHQFIKERKTQFEIDMKQVRSRFVHYFLTLIQKEGDLLDSTDALRALSSFIHHLPNIRHAWWLALADGRVTEINNAIRPLATFYVRTGLFQEGRDTFKSALANLEKIDLDDADRLVMVQAQLLIQQARFAYILADYDTGLTAAQAALKRLADQDDAALIAQAQMEIGRALEGKCNYDEAQKYLDRALQLATTEKLPFVQVNSYRTLGHVYLFQGEYAAAQQHYQLALAAAEEAGYSTLKIHMVINLGNVAYYQAEFASARRYYEQAIDLAQEVGDKRIESNGLANLGRILLDSGEYHQAQIVIKKAMKLKNEIGDGYGVAIMQNSLGDIALNLGRLAQAGSYYQTSLKFYEQAGNLQATSHVLANIALVMHLKGEQETALSFCRNALELAESVGAATERGDALTRMGHVCAALGQIDQAQSAYKAALRLRRKLKQPNRTMEPLAGLARLALIQNDPKRGLPYVDEILAFLKQKNLGGIVQPFLVYLTCYQLLLVNGDPRSTAVLNAAWESLQQRAARIEHESDRRAFLEDVAAHRHLAAAWKESR